MLLLTLTRQPLQLKSLPNSRVRTFEFAPFHVGIVYSDIYQVSLDNDRETVLLEAFPARPSDPLLKLRLDHEAKRLTITRSLMSGRPIYFHENAEGEWFISSRVTDLAHCGVVLRENRSALPEYLVYRVVLPPKTLYEGIAAVTKGSDLSVSVQGSRCALTTSESRFYDLAKIKKHNLRNSSVGEVRERLESATRSLEGEGELACFLLSGGLDSSILSKIGQRLLNIETSYSAGFPFEREERNREKHYALSAAEAMGLKHTYHSGSREAYLTGVLEAIDHAQQPVHHLQSVLLHLLFQNGMPERARWVVVGEGADGTFGAVPHHNLLKYQSNRTLFAALRQPPVLAALRTVTRKIGRAKSLPLLIAATEHMHADYDDPDNFLRAFQRYGDPAWVRGHLKVDDSAIFANRLALVKPMAHADPLDVISILALFGSDLTQRIWGSLSEAAGKRAIHPFTSPEVLETSFSLESRDKLSPPKRVLREVARQLAVPEFIITRGKSGFGIRADRWSGPGGLFEPLVLLAAKVVDIGELRLLQTTYEPHAMTLWNLINYAIWKRRFIQGESLESLKAELLEHRSHSQAA